MSHTTDITLILGILDDLESLRAFNEALKAAGVQFDGDCPALHSLGSAINQLPGRKYYTDFIAAACWNYGSSYTATLISVFSKFDWIQPENAILIIAPEQEAAQVHRPEDY